ncbi:MAG: hypothetical protein AAB267_04115, partial [Candidatus Desantisbacteria bacterium]
ATLELAVRLWLIWKERIPKVLRQKRELVGLSLEEFVRLLPSQMALSKEDYIRIESGEVTPHIGLVKTILDQIQSEVRLYKEKAREERVAPSPSPQDGVRAEVLLGQILNTLEGLRRKDRELKDSQEEQGTLTAKNVVALNHLLEDIPEVRNRL